ncbi:integrase and RNaseH domain-containing protein, partial [Golovinomyces cichoracearum]
DINESDQRTPSREEFYHLFIDTKGIEESDYINITETSEALGGLKIDKEYGTFWTEMGEIDGFQTVAILNDQSAFHGIKKEDIFVDQQVQIPPSSVFTCDRYSSAVFHGIIPDTGTAGV